MLRVAREAWVFPLIDMEGRRSEYLDVLVSRLRTEGFEVEVVGVEYEFQRGGNEMLRVRRGGRL
jgi:hypothetical protein